MRVGFSSLTTVLIGTISMVWAQVPDFTPPTPLISSVLRGDTAETKRLLAAGANPNEGTFFGSTPVLLALTMQNPAIAKALIAKGADVKALDPNGSTTLMWAATSETADTTMVKELLALGVDPNVRNKSGETALQWAMRRGHTPVVDELKPHSITQSADIKDAVERSLALLQKSGVQFLKVSTCSSCHHQALPQMVNALARERGYSVDGAISAQQVKATIAMYRPVQDQMLAGKENIPDPAISVSYALLGLHAEGYKPDATTEAMAHLIATQQDSDGGFRVLPGRPPMESTRVTGTALSVRALQLYGKDPSAQIRRAVEWLKNVKPRTNEERSMQLLGLAWAKYSGSEVKAAAKALLAEQRPDGGWGQLPALESDAYATGQAVVALHTAGVLRFGDVAFERATSFLLRTQYPDGSWLVRTRSIPFQPLKDSGFPHGRHQWISAAGTSWAAMALSLPGTAQPQQVSRVY